MRHTTLGLRWAPSAEPNHRFHGSFWNHLVYLPPANRVKKPNSGFRAGKVLDRHVHATRLNRISQLCIVQRASPDCGSACGPVRTSQVTTTSSHTGVIMRLVCFAVLVSLLVCIPAAAQTPSDEVSAGFLSNVKPYTLHGVNGDGGGILGRQSLNGTIGVDSVVNWTSYFYESGPGSAIVPGYFQYAFPYTMVGNAPFGPGDSNGQESTTWVNAPVVAVSIDLRNADGSPRFVNGHRLFYDATQYIPPVLASPIYSKARFDSSDSPTQFMDAVMRADSFTGQATSGIPCWHRGS